MGLQQLLNTSKETDFEELLFWGKINGMQADYYIAMGIIYTDRYEFPYMTFYYASSSDFVFKPFPELNDQHKDEYDKITSIITGNPKLIHKKVEPEVIEGQEE